MKLALYDRHVVSAERRRRTHRHVTAASRDGGNATAATATSGRSHSRVGGSTETAASMLRNRGNHSGVE
jgi:hypothetical protein